MTEQLTIITERVDDIPVLIAQSEQMGLAELLDGYVLVHGNWIGTSLGWTTTIWLAHILSQGDHRLNQVQVWVAHRLHVLQSCTGQPLHALEWSDDHLALVLEFRARQRLTATNATVVGLYAGNPKRTISRPTAEALLKAFEYIDWSLVTLGN